MYGKADILLKSGFISNVNPNYIRGKSDKPNANVLNYQVTYPGMTHYSNDVVDLSKYYGQGKMTSVNMELTDRIANITKTLFPEISIVDWVNYNISKISLSVVHRGFLHDFMKLVMDEKQNAVDLSMYINLLDPVKGSINNDEINIYKDIKISNEEVLCRILSKNKPGEDTYGLVQYLLFLTIVFGI